MEDLPYRVLQLLDFMLPAYAANMVPPFTKYWRGWNRPIAARRLGTHKTVVGFTAGVCTAVLVTFVQSYVGWTDSLVPRDRWLGIRDAKW